jgi:MFS family permease
MATASSLLRQRDFSLFIIARFFANIGAQMQTVALGLQVYAKTSDPFDLGMVGLSQFLPFVVLVLPAGQLADRKDRRLIVACCYAVQCLCALSLLAFTWADISSVWPIFGVMTVLGAARAFSAPAVSALLPNLLPREFFQRAVALNSSIFTVSTITGPVLGGLLFMAGVKAVYATVACMALLGVVMIVSIKAREPAAKEVREGRWLALLSGLRFVRSKPMILGAISLDLFAVLFGGATALLPVYASDVLHVGSTGLGLLRTAPGVGSMVCALILWNAPMVAHVGRWLFGSIFCSAPLRLRSVCPATLQSA